MSTYTANIEAMNQVVGYDVVIVCTSTEAQAAYWQERLLSTRGQCCPTDCKVIGVNEDWDGGAGNGLGTLYAYKKAVAKASELYGEDISEKLAAGTVSVGLYHTAGKGTRLAPLPGSENNNKPGVKLPAVLKMEGQEDVTLTILEAVIKQTGVYAASRPGRLSVFWGDQVFIPQGACSYNATAHIDILAALGPMPDEAEWEAKEMHKYGLIAVNSAGSAAQVEKVTYPVATKLLASLGGVDKVGTSLGSFSVSSLMLQHLITEFAAELDAKVGKLDTDPHFWMPLTLEEGGYIEIMGQKGTSAEEATAHFTRMAAFKKTFMDAAAAGSTLFGAVDVGSSCYWWDYGQVKLYLKNNMLALGDSDEAAALRLFLGITSASMGSTGEGLAGMDASSRVLGSKIVSGGASVKGSLLVNVSANEVQAEGAMLVNVTAKSIVAKNCLVYNIVEDGELNIAEGDVLVGITLPSGETLRMKSNMANPAHDGGTAWKVVLEGNPYSFEEVYNINGDANVTELDKIQRAAHKALADQL